MPQSLLKYANNDVLPFLLARIWLIGMKLLERSVDSSAAKCVPQENFGIMDTTNFSKGLLDQVRHNFRPRNAIAVCIVYSIKDL